MENTPAILMLWLIGLFVLIGFVMFAVANLVRKDTLEYDREFLWRGKKRPGEESEERR